MCAFPKAVNDNVCVFECMVQDARLEKQRLRGNWCQHDRKETLTRRLRWKKQCVERRPAGCAEKAREIVPDEATQRTRVRTGIKIKIRVSQHRRANVEREGDADANQTLTTRKTHNTQKTWPDAPDMDNPIHKLQYENKTRQPDKLDCTSTDRDEWTSKKEAYKLKRHNRKRVGKNRTDNREDEPDAQPEDNGQTSG